MTTNLNTIMSRLTADERRTSVLAAALAEFARRGYDGTSTESIAERAGISQPYLFRLFAGKKALFIAAIESGFTRVVRTFERAAEGLDGEAALQAMGDSYRELLEDRELLLCQLQAYAASDDADVRTATRKAFRRLWTSVAGLSGAEGEELVRFFAMGMLFNVSAALDLDEINQEWSRLCSKLPGSWSAGPDPAPPKP